MENNGCIIDTSYDNYVASQRRNHCLADRTTHFCKKYKPKQLIKRFAHLF
jgi:uncharacterized short protein YbdD (DUF466 family)